MPHIAAHKYAQSQLFAESFPRPREPSTSQKNIKVFLSCRNSTRHEAIPNFETRLWPLLLDGAQEVTGPRNRHHYSPQRQGPG